MRALRAMRHAAAAAALAAGVTGCVESAKLPLSAGIGTDPALPPPTRTPLPTVHIAPAKGWPAGMKPVAATGTTVSPFATGLAHPRWLYVLPSGDVLVAETSAPPSPPRASGAGPRTWC
jgi:glucose/arabinose dehydrogenase